MPFGAEYRQDGTVRFRLWAPAARTVQVRFEGAADPLSIPLEPRDGGWFELLTEHAAPGTKYRFRINHQQEVPDPASRFQPEDVSGPSEVIDPSTFDWQDLDWHGRPWHEAVIYELHVGAFTSQGRFSAVRDRLDYLADLGITALELMPVSDFSGRRNWGYDGVLPFAPDSTYGRPEDLKELVQSAHRRGIMVLLDVVYNHFGPEGNYLGVYAPQFFTDRHLTPWGNGINFDGPASRVVRDFFIHNALYWLREYHFDGLRLDAVHAILDDSRPDILTELATTIQSIVPDRHIHLVLENDNNESSRLQRGERCQPRSYTAQWNDDIHHALHVSITGEKDGYYRDYSEKPVDNFGRCLTQGFAYQGEVSKNRGRARGEITDGLPLTAFVSFLQNHDQVGNRACGERITKLAGPRAIRAAASILLLAPSPPLLFMGEEFGAETPFLFFCDFKDDLAAAVTSGRRAEFEGFSEFRDPASRERIPDPNADTTFAASRLDWNDLEQSRHREHLAFYRELLRLRRKHLIPRLSSACRLKADYTVLEDRGLTARWTFQDNAELTLMANLSANPLPVSDVRLVSPFYCSDEVDDLLQQKQLPPWWVAWFLKA